MLVQNRVGSKDLFQANEMHQSYLNIMKEREKVIEQLHNQIKKLGEARIMNEQPNNASFGNYSSYQMKQSTVEAKGNGRMTSLGIGSRNNNSKMTGPMPE